MDEKARAGLISTMARGEGHVLMAVLGGIFSEGVDLPGDALVGVVVVGPSLPQANLSRRLMQQWYQDRYKQGFRYAWLVPGMCRSSSGARSSRSITPLAARSAGGADDASVIKGSHHRCR